MCHVSPAGENLASPYGRGAADEFMYSWGYDGEGYPLWGAAKSEYNHVGGDFRYLAYQVKQNDQTTIYPFLMQAEVEYATNIGRLTAVGSYGTYGSPTGKTTSEARRYYALYNLSDHFNVRVGRFLPTFGIGMPDHTLYTRAFMGRSQGNEQEQAELSILYPLGEAFLSAQFGEWPGATAKITYLVNNRYAIGLNGRYYHDTGSVRTPGVDRDINILGLHAMAGFTEKSFALFEGFYKGVFDNVTLNDTDNAALMLQGGYYLARGLYVFSTVQGAVEIQLDGSNRRSFKHSVGINWMPRPHLELSTEFGYENTREDVTSLGVFLFHFWL